MPFFLFRHIFWHGLKKIFVFLTVLSLFFPYFIFPSRIEAGTNYSLSSSSNYDAVFYGASGEIIPYQGTTVIGDVNGDGKNDLIVVAGLANNNGTSTGSVWILFSGTYSGETDLTTGSNYNIRIDGNDGDQLGRYGQVKIGDVNADGYDDLILGTSTGRAYVLFSTLIDNVGSSTGNVMDLATSLNYNIRFTGSSTGFLTNSGLMGVADVNVDGHGDLILGDNLADYNGTDSGSLYVILSTIIDNFSTTGNDLSLDSVSDYYNVRFDGATAGDNLGGNFVGAALGLGDVNGDGNEDIVVGAPNTDYNSISNGGSAYVLFSTLVDNYQTTGNTLLLSDSASYNIRYDGTSTAQLTTGGINIGDVNGDGLSDLVLGGSAADNNGSNTGSVWVMFSTLVGDAGQTTGNDNYLATGTNYNIRFDGSNSDSSPSLSNNNALAIGDVNGDGYADLVMGADQSDSPGTDAGAAYVVYSTLIDDVGSLTGQNHALNNTSYYNIRYTSSGGNRLTTKGGIKIGDVTGDGAKDLILGTYVSDNTYSNSGSVWVIDSTLLDDNTTSGNQLSLTDSANYSSRYDGPAANSFLSNEAFYGSITVGDINNDSANDLIMGARGASINSVSGSGAVYVIYSTLTNSNPDDPSSLGGHTNGGFINDNTPALTFTLSDPDVGNTVKYEIQIDDNSDFSSPVVDYTSALASQGSATFTVGQAAGSGSYTTGSEGQTLTDGSYYWQVKAIDASAAESSFTLANSGSIAFKVDATSPSVPTSLSITSPTTDNTPPLTWSASSDSGSGLAGAPYTVEWCTDSSFTGCGSNTDTVGATSFTNSTALADGTWYFRVKASDAVGNTSSPSSNATVVIDSTAPSDISLDSPGGNEYTNNQRPTFKWNATSDSGGLSKYVLSVNNGDSGSFTIDNIGVSGTSAVETNRYVINYENFGDGDSTNNYISVYTKSSSDWTSNQNDGKLYEGKRSWTVTAYDSSGNTTSTSRDLYVDLTNPGLSSVNITPGISEFDVSGTVSDTKAGSKSSGSDYLRSNPDSVDIEITKNGYLLNETIATATVNISSTCDYSDTTSDSLSCSFSIAIDADFGYGNFTVKVTGKDKAGNSVTTENDVSIGGTFPGPTPSSYPSPTLSPTSAPDISASPTPTLTPTATINFSTVWDVILNFIENSREKIVAIASFVFDSFSYNARIAVNVVSKGAQVIIQNTGIAIAAIADTPQKVISQVIILINKPKPTLVTLGNEVKSAGQKVSWGVGVVVQNSKVAIVKIGETPQKTKIAIGNLIGKSKATFGPPTQKVTYRLWFIYSAIVPGQRTQISSINVESVTNNSAVITWDTNHPATSKVNFGEDKTMGETIYDETPVTKHQLTLNNLKEKTDIYFEIISEGRTTAYDSFRIFTTK